MAKQQASIEPRKHRALVRSLLDWFARNARDLPWRRTRDPYAIWISEIMLQQTQVKTVLPYYERWMEALPTIKSVARAELSKLYKLWAGLGYYSRVRNIQQAALLIVRKHGGKFPQNFEAVLALPGIGRYTAGAICSIAFNQSTPILDGNVVRILTRCFGIDGNPRDQTTSAKLWQLSEQLVLASATCGAEPACSQFNQAMMELGALVCTRAVPNCSECPWASNCVAKRQNRIGELPALPARPKTTRRHFFAFVIRSGDRYLVRQRPAGEVNGHLWEFPNVEVESSAADPSDAAHAALGARPSDLQPLCTINHTITRYRMHLTAFAVAANGASQLKGRWLDGRQLRRLGFPSAHNQILQKLL